MNEETKSPDKKTIKLTEQQYAELERAMQWPEDLAAYDQSNRKINLSELLGSMTVV